MVTVALHIKLNPQTTGPAAFSYKARACHPPCHQEAQHRDQAGAEPQQVEEPRVRAFRCEQGGDADGGGGRHDRHQREGRLVGVQLGERGSKRDKEAFALERTRGWRRCSLPHRLTSLTPCASL